MLLSSIGFAFLENSRRARVKLVNLNRGDRCIYLSTVLQIVILTYHIGYDIGDKVDTIGQDKRTVRDLRK